MLSFTKWWFSQLVNSPVSEEMQQICCEFGLSLLILEEEDDIVKELEVEAVVRGTHLQQGTQERACVMLCVPRLCRNIPAKLPAHKGTNLLGTRCDASITRRFANLCSVPLGLHCCATPCVFIFSNLPLFFFFYCS